VQRVVGVEGDFLQDEHGHLVVDHDLYNHEGLTEDGIAEAFMEFAKKENLSFFEPSSSVTPFDAVRYQRLMDGLEAAEVTLNDLRADSNVLRIDSEFYQKHYLQIAELLESKGATDIRTINAELDCSAFYPAITQHYRYQSFEDIPFLRVDEIQAGLIQITDNTVFLPEEILNDNQSTICGASEGDIVIAKGGNTLAKIGLIPDKFSSYAVCRDVIVLRTNELSGCNRYFLWAFLYSQYGYNLMLRTASQTGQPHLTLDAIYGISVPITTTQFQKKFEALYHLNKQLKDDSAFLYQQAEDLLLSELGLKDWQLTEETVAVKSFAESFLSSGRLDAEYYEPKQQKVMAIMRQSGLCISDVVSLAKRKFQPEAQGTFNYIEIGNLSGEGFANSEAVAMEEAPSRAQWIVQPNDVITSTVRPIRRLSALIEPEQNHYICSSGFAVLKPTQIEPEVLLVYLRSPVVCEILDLHTTASMYPAISTEDLLNIPITLPKESTRRKITEKVKESRKSREQSKQLLEIAKTGVERAIETDEAAATAWINEQLEVFDIKLTQDRTEQ